MTEDEAKTKWCPFVRVGGPMQSEAEGTTANRWPGDDPVRSDSPYLCIGSACMAWREKKVWKAPEVRTSKNPAEDAVLVVVGGYCGLAGEPR